MNLINNKIEDNTYTKYLDEIEYYYKLKKKYDMQKSSYINKLITSEDTNYEVKKKLFSKFKTKCVNCGKDGGTIFKETNVMLHAVCGNTLKPCNLNLKIVKLNSVYLDKELINVSKKMRHLKELIISTKLDYIFKYIDEDRVVEIFNDLKSQLSKVQEQYVEIMELYNSIVNNTTSAELLKSKMDEYNTIISKILELSKIYYTTYDKEYLRSSLEMYVKLPELNDEILNLKYKHNNVIEEDVFKLEQDKYNITDLEIITKPTLK